MSVFGNKKRIKWQLSLFNSLYKIPLLWRLTWSLCGYNFLQGGQAIELFKAHKPIIPATPCKAVNMQYLMHTLILIAINIYVKYWSGEVI